MKRVALNPMTDALMEEKADIVTQRGLVRTRQRLKGHGHKPRDAWNPRGWERREGSSSELLEGTQACQYLDFRLLVSRPVGESVSII